MPIVAPSILTANFLQLERTCNMLHNSEADWFHLDIMDGSFVPNISFGFAIVEQIRKTTSKILDAHLMIQEPEKYIGVLKNIGVNSVTIHLEACPHLHRNIQQIKENGMRVGVAINPHSPVCLLQNILHEVDLVCLMSVNAGFGGQKFIAHTLVKIKELKRDIQNNKLKTLIQVDGGVNLNNANEILSAGANILVVGNAVFDAPDPQTIIAQFKHL